jgi:subtilisin family serine protease
LLVASVVESEIARTSLIRLANGMEWLAREFTLPAARRRPAVVNVSLGYPSTGMPGVGKKLLRRQMVAIERIVGRMEKAGILTIVAIGNDGAGKFSLPGGLSSVLGIGALDFEHREAEFSGSSKDAKVRKPDLFGYGVQVYSSVERDYEGKSSYEAMSGTSMAAPFVTGIAALNLCRQPELTAADLLKKLLEDATTGDDGMTLPVARFQATA